MNAENNGKKPHRQNIFTQNPLLDVALAIVLTSLCVWLAFYLGADPNVVHVAEAAIAIAVAAAASWVGLRRRKSSTDNASAPKSADDQGSQSASVKAGEPADDASDIATTTRMCEALAARYGLSQRECDVLVLLTQGMTRQDIEETLVISMNTVKSHIRHIYQKLNVHSREELEKLIEESTPSER